MKHLKEILKNREAEIIEKWLNRLIESYPKDTQRFLRKEKDRFANPVGYIMKNEIRNLYHAFLDKDEKQMTESLNNIIKIRAVQDFTPSSALYFILELKEVIDEELDSDSYSLDDWEKLNKEITSLLLKAFDIYEQCRYRLYELRINEIKNQVNGLLRMANLVYEVPEVTSK